MRALALAALLALPVAAAAAIPVPPLTGPVVDEAHLLDRADVRRLEALAVAARSAEGGRGIQLQYLIVPTLEGEPIEDYSIRVAEAWKIGSKGKDNGVLVTVATKDRQVRIEVGGGIEGGLTDLQASRIIRETIVPAFRAGQYGAGLYDAGVRILAALGALPRDVSPVATARRPATHFSSLAILALFLVVFLFRVFAGFSPRRRRSMWWGGPWGGGGFGGFGGGGFGGGGGGGGWSGGGGGFSGGGASGRW